MEHRCSTKDGSRTAAYGEPPTDMMEPTSSARSVTIPLPRRGCCTTDIDASSPSMHDINTCGGPFHTDGLLSNLDVTPKLCRNGSITRLGLSYCISVIVTLALLPHSVDD